MALHHIISDGGTFGILFRELEAHYVREVSREGAACATAPERAALTYRDFVHWQAELLEKDGETLARFWKRALHDVPTNLDLPLDRPRPKLRQSNGATHKVRVAGPVLDGLRGLGWSLFRTVLAAYEIFLYRYTGQRKFVIGTPVDCRPPAFKEVGGLFANMIVLPNVSRFPT